MKQTIILLSILLILGGVYYYINNQKDEKIEAIMSERDFTLDESEIEKVVITEKDGNVNTLTHEGDIWFVNGNRISRNQKHLLLEALTKVRMESIPPKGAYKQIMTTIGKIGILVRVYGKNDELLKSYYVGGVPQGERGTYYLMEGSKQPYLMSIPGMEGSTRGRFIKKSEEWLDRAMFRYPNKDIQKITVDYPRAKSRSYSVEKIDGQFQVEPLSVFTEKIDKPQNDRLVEDYLENFYVGFFTEAYSNDFYLKDSVITHMKPFCILKVEDTKGEVKELDLYPLNEVYDLPGEALGPEVDNLVERYFVNVNKGENFMLTQHILAKKFLWGYDYFFR